MTLRHGVPVRGGRPPHVGARRAERRPTLARPIAFALALALAGAAAGHAYLERADPPAGGVGEAPLEALELEFAMAVEVRFSTFEVYRLAVDAAAAPADPSAPTERELQRLAALGGVLARDARDGAAAADEARVAASVDAEGGTTRLVRLMPDEPLDPGIYVVVWEVLATDGHVTRDHHVILVVPPGG